MINIFVMTMMKKSMTYSVIARRAWTCFVGEATSGDDLGLRDGGHRRSFDTS